VLSSATLVNQSVEPVWSAACWSCIASRQCGLSLSTDVRHEIASFCSSSSFIFWFRLFAETVAVAEPLRLLFGDLGSPLVAYPPCFCHTHLIEGKIHATEWKTGSALQWQANNSNDRPRLVIAIRRTRLGPQSLSRTSRGLPMPDLGPTLRCHHRHLRMSTLVAPMRVWRTVSEGVQRRNI
jgi:hypothetical protein